MQSDFVSIKPLMTMLLQLIRRRPMSCLLCPPCCAVKWRGGRNSQRRSLAASARARSVPLLEQASTSASPAPLERQPVACGRGRTGPTILARSQRRLRYLSRPTQRREAQPVAQYKLHCFCQSGNSYKVALYLNCAGLDWEPVFVDFFNGATRDPKWRESVNEMGEAPVLEMDGDASSRQSGVILQLPRRDDRQVRAGRRGRAHGGAALDPVRQPQVHRATSPPTAS